MKPSRALEKRPLGQSGIDVTFLGFGALEIGRNWGLGSGRETERPAEKEAGATLNAVLDLGVNLIDTASAYHASEARIGTSIAHRRREYVLASKCGEHSREPHTFYDFSYRAVKDSIDRSLSLLRTNVIDLMQIHFGPAPEQVLDDGETVRAMRDARREGKVRLLGASTGGSVARRCIDSGDFEVMQLEHSLLFRGDEPLIRLCRERKIGVLIRGGLGYGKLTARVLPHLGTLEPGTAARINALLDLAGGDPDLLTALALQFLYRNAGITSVLAGSRSIAHFRRDAELLDVPIDESLFTKAAALTPSPDR